MARSPEVPRGLAPSARLCSGDACDGMDALPRRLTQALIDVLVAWEIACRQDLDCFMYNYVEANQYLLHEALMKLYTGALNVAWL